MLEDALDNQQTVVPPAEDAQDLDELVLDKELAQDVQEETEDLMYLLTDLGESGQLDLFEDLSPRAQTAETPLPGEKYLFGVELAVDPSMWTRTSTGKNKSRCR